MPSFAGLLRLVRSWARLLPCCQRRLSLTHGLSCFTQPASMASSGRFLQSNSRQTSQNRIRPYLHQRRHISPQREKGRPSLLLHLVGILGLNRFHTGLGYSYGRFVALKYHDQGSSGLTHNQAVHCYRHGALLPQLGLVRHSWVAPDIL